MIRAGGDAFRAFEQVADNFLAACGSLPEFAECLRRSIWHAALTGDCSRFYSLLGSAQWPELLLVPVPNGADTRFDQFQTTPALTLLALAVELGLLGPAIALMDHGVDPVSAEHAIARAFDEAGEDEEWPYIWADEDTDEAADEAADEVCVRHGFMARPPAASFLSCCMTKGVSPELVSALLARGCRSSNLTAYSVDPLDHLRHDGKPVRVSLIGAVATRADLEVLRTLLECPDVEAVVRVMGPRGVSFSEPLLDFAERVCPPKAPGIAALLTRLRGG